MLRQASKGGEDKDDQGKLRGRTVTGSAGETDGHVCEYTKSREQGRRLHSVRVSERRDSLPRMKNGWWQE